MRFAFSSHHPIKERTAMRLQILVLAAALALAAGCNKGSDRAKPAAGAASAPPQSQANTPTTPQVNTPTTPTTPASAGSTASQEEKKEGASPPVQGQVDAKSAEQHRDFQQKGDAAGPKAPDTPSPSGK
jgi:hypothetical protein